MLKRMLDVREALETTIVTRAWRDWLAKQDVQTRNLGSLVVETVTDVTFWDEAQNVISMTKPIWKLLKYCDGDGPRMGEIYERMDNMVGEIKDIMALNKHKDDYVSVESILIGRWDKMTIPLHCLAYALSPRFYDPVYLEARAPGVFTRRAPNLDKEVVKGCMDAFDKIGENDAEKQMLRDQFVDFQKKKGLFSLPQAKTDAVVLEAIEWWSLYGSETPELAEIAKKILSQPVSSSSAERAWSMYGFIHSLKRNRLLSSRADKLVFIHCNLRLLSRLTKEYRNGPYRKWDINPDYPCLEDSPAELEDMRWRSLNTEFEDVVVEEGQGSGSCAPEEEHVRVSKKPRVDQVYVRGGRK